MTKLVRIENADNSDYKVIVQIWDKAINENGDVADVLFKEVKLDYPTAMTDSSVYLTSTRYLVVKEA